MKQNIGSPVTDRFPDLSDFITIVRNDDDGYLLGAGQLADGLIVPLFPDTQAATEIVNNLSDDPRDLNLRVTSLGDPFKAMRKAAGEGAAGFQFSSGLFTDRQREEVFRRTDGRILFPFMTRREEAGGQWPTVLGSAAKCDAGIYLTRRGPNRFGSHDLCQWVRWDVMDRASAKLALEQPFRSHEPGEAFWCLEHAPGAVQFTDARGHHMLKEPSITLFARDTALRQFVPPEGYYPVFTSEDSATNFLNQRLGGAFHIMGLVEGPNANSVKHSGIMAQDLGQDGALIAQIVQIDDLLMHLAAVREIFRLPPWASFVLNPAGHREDVAWGLFANVDEDGLLLKSVGAKWKLTPGHQYTEQARSDQFDGEDTFFLGPSEYRFAELRRSLGRFTPFLEDENLQELSATEREESIHDFIVRGAEDTLVENIFASSIQLDVDEDAADSGCKLDNEGNEEDRVTSVKTYAPFLGAWVLNFWETVDGEKLGPFYFDTPFHVARALYHLELQDRPVRVSGKHGYSSIGFDGSGNPDLEAAGGNGLATTLIKICQRMVERGYQPEDALDMTAVANATLKSFRICLCSNVADALISHIPNDARPPEHLMEDMGLPSGLREQLIELIEANVDPQGDRLLRERIGDKTVKRLPARTHLFLATALIQFETMGNSPCIDYAPVSVQIVKALEFEIRELAAALVRGFIAPPEPVPETREEETLFHVLADQRQMVSLGSITHALKAMRNAKGKIIQYAADQLQNFGMQDLTHRKTVGLILNDVLKRFRNGGAHEYAIDYATCHECIESLVGSEAEPGLILQVGRWRV